MNIGWISSDIAPSYRLDSFKRAIDQDRLAIGIILAAVGWRPGKDRFFAFSLSAAS